jgi:hypothetical protein
MFRIVGRDEPLPRLGIGHLIAGRYDVGAPSTQHTQNALEIANPGCAHESIGGLFGGLKRLLGATHGCHCKNEHRSG